LNEILKKEDRREVEFIGDPKRDLLMAKNVRESEIEYLSSKRSLSHIEVECANKYRRLFETTELKAGGDNMSMTVYGCKIDGGGSSKDKLDNQLKALNTINYVHRCIGENATHCLQHIVGQGYTLKEYAQIRNISTRKSSKSLKEALYMALEPLGLTKVRHTIRA
tara:strand:+ start:8946 stop:9440 length:495 start_codon:yes stop_codon:yes gene_type:complete